MYLSQTTSSVTVSFDQISRLDKACSALLDACAACGSCAVSLWGEGGRVSCLHNWYIRTDPQTAVVNGLLGSCCGHSHTDMHVCNYNFKVPSLTNLRNWTPRQQVAGQPVISSKVDRLNTSAAGSGNAEDCCIGSDAHKGRQQDALLLTRRRFLLGSATAAGSLGSLPLPPQYLRLLSLPAIIVLRSVSLSSRGLLISYQWRTYRHASASSGPSNQNSQLRR